MTETTPTRLWNDSADIDELKYSIENGAVGATCNPVIAVTILKKHIAEWRPRIEAFLGEMPAATEDQVGWKLVEEMSVKAAKLLEPAFAAHGGRDGRLSIQTDPRLYRDTAAIVENAMAFSRLAQNMIVKIPATRAGIVAIEEVTYRGVSINATVSFTLPQCIAVAEAVERGLSRREAEGKAIAADLAERIVILSGKVGVLSARRDEITRAVHATLRERIAALFPQVPLDSGRLEQEAALAADRSDIAEELQRLEGHLEQFAGLLASSTGPVGKRLDFLSQEILRELNTLGSKARDLRLIREVLEMKSETEKIREQVQNVE